MVFARKRVEGDVFRAGFGGKRRFWEHFGKAEITEYTECVEYVR